MRTATTKTFALPTIHLAIESQKHSRELQAELSLLDCNCHVLSSFSELEQILEDETSTLLVASLDFGGPWFLPYCQNHQRLFHDVPVVFFADDPLSSFDKALEAVKAGAADVLTTPIELAKSEQLVALARRQANCSEGSVEDDMLPNGATSSEALTSTPFHQDGPSQQNQATCRDDSVSKSQISLNHPMDSGPSAKFSGSFDESCSQRNLRLENHASNVKELESWILGSSPAMQAVRSIIAEVAETKANVMIYGASGTGKELVATAVHKLSKRREGPFEPVNMTEIPHELAESLLFGHEKGAFTGADSRQIGVCEAADGGTLFLDEIGEMALATQPKLLRFLQEGTVKRIGSRTLKKVDVRVITATNRTPETIVKEGMMREDLFFRLHVVPIHIPPLQERPEDIEQLAMLFLQRYVKAYDRSVEGFTEAALDIFRRHDWPGNVRQLENVVERLVVFAKGRLIDVPDIPSEIHAASMFDGVANSTFHSHQGNVFAQAQPYIANGQDTETASAIASMSAIQRTERSAIIEALQRSDGHVIDAANLLGLGQATVYRKIKQYHIPHERRRRRRTPK